MVELVAPIFVPVPPASVAHIAVALSRNNFEGAVRSHLSIIYRASSGSKHVLDFLLDGQIRSISVEAATRRHRFTWAVPQFPEIILQAIAKFCETLGESKQRFPYWIDFPEDSRFFFDGDGSIELQGDAVGLTCATFVLAVFASQKKDLLDMNTWSEGDDARTGEDDDWQRWILAKLREDPPAYGISESILEQVDERLPFLRYRPEDIIGACQHGEHPTHFNPSSELGVLAVHWTDMANADFPVWAEPHE